jgi:cytochrome c oxidase cbb3-type subunit 3
MNTKSFAALAVIAALACSCGKAHTEGSPVIGPERRIAVGPLPGPKTATPLLQNPFGGDDGARAAGRQWFVRFNCSGCHGGHAGGGMGPSLRDTDWLYGSTDGAIFSSIAEGRGKGMPAWSGRVADEQIWQLVSYLHALRTSDEPEPPS